MTPQTWGFVDNPSTRGIHVGIECLNATNECLSTRDSNISKNGHVGPYIHHTHKNISNYITIVSRVNYTPIQTCINLNVSYMFYKII